MKQLLLKSQNRATGFLKTGIFIAFAFAFYFGCTPNYLTQEALDSYLREPSNGLIKSNEQGNTEVIAIYRPTDLLIAQELQDEAEITKINDLRKKYDKYTYFILTFSSDDKDALYNSVNNYGDFSSILQKLSFRMGDYMHLTTSAGDTVSLSDYHFSRMYGMGGSTQLLLAFDRKKIEDNEWIQLNLKEMGLKTGRVNMRFNVKDIKRTPQIDFIN